MMSRIKFGSDDEADEPAAQEPATAKVGESETVTFPASKDDNENGDEGSAIVRRQSRRCKCYVLVVTVNCSLLESICIHFYVIRCYLREIESFAGLSFAIFANFAQIFENVSRPIYIHFITQ